VFRYANIYERASAGSVRQSELETRDHGTFHFSESIEAFERVARGLPSDVKLQILLDEENG
jgi:D-xylulose reductase